jgi:2-polyprenyl-6-methoxyphenol hydroxylase-like FAD-dependent oxidoreductase
MMDRVSSSRFQHRVGIVGAGVTGLTLATLLAGAGHDVQVLEQVEDPAPIGAGILLQPLGQQVAARLGIADDLRARSAPVRRVDGATYRGKPTMTFRYDAVPGGHIGWGVHRGVLFELLWAAAVAAGARTSVGTGCREVTRTEAGWRIRDQHGVTHGPFDVVVGADGMSSAVRRGLPGRFGRVVDREYRWGAAWAIVDDPDGDCGDALVQRYRGTAVTLGFLPTAIGQASIFWAVRLAAAGDLATGGGAGLVRAASPYAGALGPLLRRAADARVTIARYRDVSVSRPAADGVVLVGDAAHAMSPQLGTGASLGMADACVLAGLLSAHPPVEALERYGAQRQAHWRYYRWWSRLMTPVFQSRLYPAGPIRDALLPLLGTLSWPRAQMVTTLSGARTSPWSTWQLPD